MRIQFEIGWCQCRFLSRIERKIPRVECKMRSVKLWSHHHPPQKKIATECTCSSSWYLLSDFTDKITSLITPMALSPWLCCSYVLSQASVDLWRFTLDPWHFTLDLWDFTLNPEIYSGTSTFCSRRFTKDKTCFVIIRIPCGGARFLSQSSVSAHQVYS